MTNRREFLQISMAASAWGLVGSQAARAGLISPTEEALGFYRAVFDDRIPESVHFATRLEQLEIAGAAMKEGDITPFWRSELQHVWNDTPVPLIGLTMQGPLFCLEQLAAQRGMRVVFRAEQHGNGLVLEGPRALLQACKAAGSGAHWPTLVADVASACPQGRIALEAMHLPMKSQVSRQADNQNHNRHAELVAWVIAPARTVTQTGTVT